MFREKIYRDYLSKVAWQNHELKYDSRFVFHMRKYYRGDLELLLQNQITFLNYTIDFGEKIEWHRDELNKGTRLWKLTLNYHEFLIDVAKEYKKNNNSIYLDYIVTTIEEWFVQNPLGTKEYGKDNWNSYAISLRLVAWIKILRLLKDHLPYDFYGKMISSLKVQVAFLYDNLEIDILANHLVKNWKALAWTGFFLDEPKYTTKARKIFKKYIVNQFSPDGMHEELSPMYAGLVLEDLMEVYLFEKNEQLQSLILKQYKKLTFLTSANGYFYFNDSVNANGPQPSELTAFYNELFDRNGGDETEEYFNFDGFIGFRNATEHLIFDAGPIVLGYQPGHGLCDALSFEYCRNGQKIFTNSGVFEYNPGERRKYSRSTEAHNTVKFGLYDQSEVRGAFRVARRAKMHYTIHEHSVNTLVINAFVKGFNFNKHNVHFRTFKKINNNISIEDRIESNEADFKNQAFAYLHLAPGFNFKADGDRSVFIICQEKHFAYIKINYPYSIVTTEYYPEFGKCLTKDTLKIGVINDTQNCITEIDFL
jgi:uncharacterized heparinase superfamily protein